MDSNHRCLDVGQESLPLDHGIVSSSRGGNRTHKLSPGSRPGRFADLRTRPRQCPADAFSPVARVGIEPTNSSPRFELGRFAGLRTVPASVPDGI